MVTLDSLSYLLDDLFSHITLYDNQVVSASYNKPENGQYEVELEVAIAKVRADSVGKESPYPLNDWIEVGVYAKPEPGKPLGKALASRSEHFDQPQQTLRFVVGEEPYEAGIDPRYLLADRFPEA